MKAQVNEAGPNNTRHLVSSTLQKEANATMIMAKQKTVLFPNGCVDWAIKQKVSLILNSLHVAVLMNAFIPWWP